MRRGTGAATCNKVSPNYRLENKLRVQDWPTPQRRQEFCLATPIIDLRVSKSPLLGSNDGSQERSLGLCCPMYGAVESTGQKAVAAHAAANRKRQERNHSWWSILHFCCNGCKIADRLAYSCMAMDLGVSNKLAHEMSVILATSYQEH